MAVSLSRSQLLLLIILPYLGEEAFHAVKVHPPAFRLPIVRLPIVR